MPIERPPENSSKLDHVMVMVRDLRVATDDFARLGFRVLPGRRFPAGIENAIVPFGLDGGYLELVSIYRPGDPLILDNEQFLAQGEGAMYVGIHVASARATAERLHSLGLEVDGPTPGTVSLEGAIGAPLVLWQSVVIRHGSNPRGDPVFFTEYNDAGRKKLLANSPDFARAYEERRRITHLNGAQRLSTVWFAVADLGPAIERYERLGFARVRDFTIPRFQSHAVELSLERGSLLLMESDDPNGTLSKLLNLHRSSTEILGVSLEVPSVNSAIGAMPSDIAGELEPSSDPWGRAVIVPPRLSHGVWIELFERGQSGT